MATPTSPGYAALISSHHQLSGIALERLNEEFKRRIKTQTVLPCPETVPMLLWALLASGQIQMRKVDGWETLDQLIAEETVDRAA